MESAREVKMEASEEMSREGFDSGEVEEVVDSRQRGRVLWKQGETKIRTRSCT